MERMEADIATGTFTEEALFEKYKDVLDAFGEEFEPMKTTPKDMDGGDEDEDVHPQLLDPYWWREARALHLITVTRSADRAPEMFTMQMVPDNIPARARPDDKYHIVAFESRRDAEKFCFLMQSKRAEDADALFATEMRGVIGMKGIGPRELQKLADEVSYGVTVIGDGRIDLSPHRSHLDVLNHVVHIGGEAYLWEFARQVKRNFDSAAAADAERDGKEKK
jgi:hypothetical protein